MESIKHINIEDKLDIIKAHLVDYYLKNNNEILVDFLIKNIFKRDFSVIAYMEVITDKKSYKLVLKETVHHPFNRAALESSNQAVVEYNIINKLYPLFVNINSCSVPRPILVVPDLEIYIMEYVEGELLADELRWARYLSPNYKYKKLIQYFYLCGKWLKYFQDFTIPHRCGPESLDSIIERAEHRLELIEKSNDSRIPKHFREYVLDLMQKYLNELDGMLIPISGRHSDFLPWNIIAGYQKITVIDYLGYEEDCIAVDLLKMIIGLEDEKICITSNDKKIRTLQEAFVNGYGEIPFIPLQALLLSEAMQRIVSIWGAICSSKNGFRRRYEGTLRIKRHLEWLTDEKRSIHECLHHSHRLKNINRVK